MIAIVCYNPSFGAAYNIKKAFLLWDETELFSLRLDWRDFDHGTMIRKENVGRIRKTLQAAKFVMVVGALGFKSLGFICPVGDVMEHALISWDDRRQFCPVGGFVEWAKELRLVIYIGGSAYFHHHCDFNPLIEAVGIKRLFLLPNLMRFGPPTAVPLFQPLEIPPRPMKADGLLVVHAPGTKNKQFQKGTRTIGKAIKQLRREHRDFRFLQIMDVAKQQKYKSIAAPAHIFIDQVPPYGTPAGLGKSGLEAMSHASVVLSAFRTNDCGKFFEPPPILPVYTQHGVYRMLRILFDAPRSMLDEMGARNRQWIKENLAFGPWLKYVRKHCENLVS